MLDSLKPLGWMATLFACVGVLYVAYTQPGSGLPLALSLGGALALGIVVIATLDVLQRRDFDRKQRARWLALVVLGLPPAAAVVYLAMGRSRTALRFRSEPLPAPERRRPPHQYDVKDPFHRG